MFTSLMSFRYLLAPVLAVLMLCGCEKSTVSVSVHGVNYTADEFSYLLIDPDQPDSSSAGEHIDPFAAGGTTCCYVLPKQWKPGIKVKIQTIHWLTKDRDRNFPEVKEEHVVDQATFSLTIRNGLGRLKGGPFLRLSIGARGGQLSKIIKKHSFTRLSLY
jgi:hypothetical protein